jgi:hypothetical protein
MRKFISGYWGTALAVIAAWRALSELLLRRRVLCVDGVLDARIADQRARRVRRALERSNLSSAHERARSRACATPDVGKVRAGDFDDLGSLEGAMRRAPSDRIDEVVARMPEAEITTDWAALLEPSTAATNPAASQSAPVPVAAFLLVLTSVAVTVAALVRPLSDGAPWLALAGVALVVAGTLVARRAA